MCHLCVQADAIENFLDETGGASIAAVKPDHLIIMCIKQVADHVKQELALKHYVVEELPAPFQILRMLKVPLHDEATTLMLMQQQDIPPTFH